MLHLRSGIKPPDSLCTGINVYFSPTYYNMIIRAKLGAPFDKQNIDLFPNNNRVKMMVGDNVDHKDKVYTESDLHNTAKFININETNVFVNRSHIIECLFSVCRKRKRSETNATCR